MTPSTIKQYSCNWKLVFKFRESPTYVTFLCRCSFLFSQFFVRAFRALDKTLPTVRSDQVQTETEKLSSWLLWTSGRNLNTGLRFPQIPASFILAESHSGEPQAPPSHRGGGWSLEGNTRHQKRQKSPRRVFLPDCWWQLEVVGECFICFIRDCDPW